MSQTINILCIGDLVGKPGRVAIDRYLTQLVKAHDIHFTVCNIENSANGFGITEKIYRELLTSPIDVMSSGNHIYARREVMDRMDDWARLIRPLNFHPSSPGNGYVIQEKHGCR